MSSLRRGHANLLCIVPILTDDPRRESESPSAAIVRTCGKTRQGNPAECISHPATRYLARPILPNWGSGAQAASILLEALSVGYFISHLTLSVILKPSTHLAILHFSASHGSWQFLCSRLPLHGTALLARILPFALPWCAEPVTTTFIHCWRRL